MKFARPILASSLVLFVAAGCGGKAETSLTVSYRTDTGVRKAHISCEPPKGVPHAKLACRRLRNRALYFPSRHMCVPLIALAVEVKGTLRGKKIDVGYDCDTDVVHRWGALTGLSSSGTDG